ncbi:hypothetical protein C8R43DRAFT_907645 [Mycena crocata]|nr:hypothetical protein C8R43DRAFT_907645 [Mycena crocata]
MLVVSSVLSSSSDLASPRHKTPSVAARAAILLRRAGKLLAALNSIWIVLACLFQFTGFYDTCWCTSSVLYLGARAYSVTILTALDVEALWSPVVAGTVLASGAVVGFVAFANVLLDPGAGR